MHDGPPAHLLDHRYSLASPRGHPDWTTLSSAGAFTVTITHPVPRVTVVDPAGELDAMTSPTLDEHLAHELCDPQRRQLILDLSHLHFFGVAGLASLLRAQHLADDQHTRLYLVSSRLVDRLLFITGEHNRFVGCPDLTIALAKALTEAQHRGPRRGRVVAHPAVDGHASARRSR